MKLDVCGWRRLESPLFSTTEFGVVGEALLVDIYIPLAQSNPWWVGDISATVHVPGTVWSAYLGLVGLTDLPRGQWSTIEFRVPPNIREALLADLANAQIFFDTNLASSEQSPLGR